MLQKHTNMEGQTAAKVTWHVLQGYWSVSGHMERNWLGTSEEVRMLMLLHLMLMLTGVKMWRQR